MNCRGPPSMPRAELGTARPTRHKFFEIRSSVDAIPNSEELGSGAHGTLHAKQKWKAAGTLDKRNPSDSNQTATASFEPIRARWGLDTMPARLHSRAGAALRNRLRLSPHKLGSGGSNESH